MFAKTANNKKEITRINKKRTIVNKIELINIDFPKSLFR